MSIIITSSSIGGSLFLGDSLSCELSEGVVLDDRGIILNGVPLSSRIQPVTNFCLLLRLIDSVKIQVKYRKIQSNIRIVQTKIKALIF